MARDYRETLVRLDHEAGLAEVWTCRRSVARKLEKLGWTREKLGQVGGTWWRGQARGVTFRNIGSIGKRPGNAQNLRRAT